ncbi:hypothetical protein [Elizabethkingia ursingii]|uniref:Uncharacterized protein n=1 Tax=Elizabethkingia ursingii TaxID=1756150 RepID=A0ABX3NCR7_9FLAO|nr:hypothetical protein [Elizabethkingia ursingii]OPB94433.1 hypothetical protein BB021_17660 [Elizabethkingia ursingii]
MSRTRIVKGIYNKITKGSHNMFAEENIVSSASREVKQKGGDGISFNTPGRLENTTSDDFKITFSIKKDSSYKTIVPLGILDYEGKYENPFFAFNFSLSQSNVDSLKFEVFDEEGKSIYSMTNLPEVVVRAVKHQTLLDSIQKKKPQFDPLKPVNIWEWKPVFIPFKVPPSDYTKIGSYIILWDGFDNDDIYDSVRFNNKKLKAKITAIKAGKQKSLEVEFSTAYDKVKWVDVKIDKKNKKINTTLRVDLRDGGANGLKCSTYITGGKLNPHWETKCPWNDIPKNKIKPNQPIIKSRTKSFTELEKLALEGIGKHWSRTNNHSIQISSEKYTVVTSPVNQKNKSLNTLDLIFNTNRAWGRSGNPGVLGKIYYNIGYCNFLDWKQPWFIDEWGYLDLSRHKVDEDFMYTSAHELGHSILKAYGTTWYSFTHDGSSKISQIPNGAKSYPVEKKSGEINLMHYFEDDPSQAKYDFNLIVASEKDVLGLLWLTKIKID